MTRIALISRLAAESSYSTCFARAGKTHSVNNGKPIERWGRKASGLRDVCAYDSGVAGSNVNSLRGADPSARTREARPDRSSHAHGSPDRDAGSVSKILGQGEAKIVELNSCGP